MVERIIDSVGTRGNKLMYLVVYLAPSDYHRYHSPAYFIANYRRHIVGYLEPVRPSYLMKHRDVLKQNERVNLLGDWMHGFFAISFIGALNVGSINLHFDDEIATNKSHPAYPYVNDKNYLLMMNQMDEKEMATKDLMSYPEYKDPKLAGKEHVFTQADVDEYVKEFDVKSLPTEQPFEMTMRDDQLLRYNLVNRFKSGDAHSAKNESE